MRYFEECLSLNICIVIKSNVVLDTTDFYWMDKTAFWGISHFQDGYYSQLFYNRTNEWSCDNL